MNQPELEILLIAIVTAAACALPGVFLSLRKMSMLSDAISHTILLGIVVAFFITEDLNSPLLLAGAALTGVLTVWLVEGLQTRRTVSEDAAIGLTFPLLFSLGVLLISRYAGNVHLDTDAVLLGELAFAPFDRLIINTVDWGPKSLYVMLVILILNLLYLGLVYKELKLATFDPLLASVMGLSPVIVHYSLMTMVSITAVGAFNAVGTILVVALMVGPPATAYFITEKLSRMLAASVALGMISAVGGYGAAWWWDVSIAGAMATMTGLIFVTTVIFAPNKGIIATIKRRRQQQYEFAALTLLERLHAQQFELIAEPELTTAIAEQLQWRPAFVHTVLQQLLTAGYIKLNHEQLSLTPAGQTYLTQANIDHQLLKYLPAQLS